MTQGYVRGQRATPSAQNPYPVGTREYVCWNAGRDGKPNPYPDPTDDSTNS